LEAGITSVIQNQKGHVKMKKSVAALLLFASVHISQAEVLVAPSGNPVDDVRLFLLLTGGKFNSYCHLQEGAVDIELSGTPEMQKASSTLAQCVRTKAIPEMEDLYSRAAEYFQSKGKDGATAALKRYVIKKQSQYQAAIPERSETPAEQKERHQRLTSYAREADEAARELKLELKSIK
jgi:hypothetical protein